MGSFVDRPWEGQALRELACPCSWDVGHAGHRGHCEGGREWQWGLTKGVRILSFWTLWPVLVGVVCCHKHRRLRGFSHGSVEAGCPWSRAGACGSWCVPAWPRVGTVSRKDSNVVLRRCGAPGVRTVFLFPANIPRHGWTVSLLLTHGWACGWTPLRGDREWRCCERACTSLRWACVFVPLVLSPSLRHLAWDHWVARCAALCFRGPQDKLLSTAWRRAAFCQPARPPFPYRPANTWVTDWFGLVWSPPSWW